jgi:hypothetical protein
LSRAIAENRPMILAGFVADWPAVERWRSLDYVENKLGCGSLPVHGYPDRCFLGRSTRIDLSMREFRARFLEADGSETEPGKLSTSIGEGASPELSSLASDVRIPDSLPRNTVPRLFFGKNFATLAHYHAHREALLCNVVGTKRMLLLAPRDFRHLYPFRWNRHRFNHSRIPFEFGSAEFDTDRFPRATRLGAIEVILQPGDALYIPLYWTHLTFSYDVSMAVTLFWKPTIRKRLTSSLVVRGNYRRRTDLPA